MNLEIRARKRQRQPQFLWVNLSSWSYVEELEQAGVALYRYQHGFMHQKVTLIDDDHCTIGTANFDNRSFRLNFAVRAARLSAPVQ